MLTQKTSLSSVRVTINSARYSPATRGSGNTSVMSVVEFIINFCWVHKKKKKKILKFRKKICPTVILLMKYLFFKDYSTKIMTSIGFSIKKKVVKKKFAYNNVFQTKNSSIEKIFKKQFFYINDFTLDNFLTKWSFYRIYFWKIKFL